MCDFASTCQKCHAKAHAHVAEVVEHDLTPIPFVKTVYVGPFLIT